MILLKPVKLLIWIVVILVVLLFVVGYFADDLAKTGIEAGGTHALGVPTSVDSVDIGFFSGTFGLEKLAVANPQAFGDGSFLELGKGEVEVSATSLLSDKIEVPRLELGGIRVNLIQGTSGSNYDTILGHLKQFQGGSEQDKGDGKRFVVSQLTISDVLVRVVPVPQLNLGEIKVPIDRIELRNVGSDTDKGVLLSELAGIVVESILRRASATGQLGNLVQGALDRHLGGLRGLADARIENLQEALGGLKLPGGTPIPGGVERGLDGAKESLKKGLGGILGR